MSLSYDLVHPDGHGNNGLAEDTHTHTHRGGRRSWLSRLCTEVIWKHMQIELHLSLFVLEVATARGHRFMCLCLCGCARLSTCECPTSCQVSLPRFTGSGSIFHWILSSELPYLNGCICNVLVSLPSPRQLHIYL